MGGPGQARAVSMACVRSREYLESFAEITVMVGRSTPLETSARIELGPYAAWNEPFRLAANVHRCYRESDGARGIGLRHRCSDGRHALTEGDDASMGGGDELSRWVGTSTGATH